MAAEQKEPNQPMTPSSTASPRKQHVESVPADIPHIANFGSTSVFYSEDALPNHASSFSHHTSFSSPQGHRPAGDEEMQKELKAFLALYQEKVKKWELAAEWVEVRETLSGNVMWYNSNTTRLVFDAPPNTEVLSVASPRSHDRSEQRSEEQQYYLNRALSPLPNENVVQSLLQFDLDAWNFDYGNSSVYNYRLSASRRDHGDMLPPPQQYVFPEYFSLAPFPDLLANKFLAKIQLPREYSKNKKYSLVQIKHDITTASDVIKAGVAKLDPPFSKNEDPSEFIIKIVGQNAYMYGKKRVIEYEAVRHALRNENDVEFALIKQLDFKEKIEGAKHAFEQDKAQFKTAYDAILAVCQPQKRSTLSGRPRQDGVADERRDTHGVQIQAEMDLPAAAINLYEFEWHYRVNIDGLTNVTSLPRYDETLVKSVYVAAELWCGDMKLTTATIRTSCVAPKPSIRWGLWLSSQNLLFSQLPREAVLCLMVFGVLSDSNGGGGDGPLSPSSSSTFFSARKYDAVVPEENAAETVCMAWCRLPLVGEESKLRSGPLLLNLWSLPKSDNYNALNGNPFRYRGTTVDRNVKALESEQCQLLVAFDEHPFDVVAPAYTTAVSMASAFGGAVTRPVGRNHAHAISLPNAAAAGDKLQSMSKKQKQSMDEIITRSPLESLQVFEKQMIWENRETLWHRPEALSAFVQSVNWCNVHDIAEAHKYLDIWAAPRHFEHAMEFLDYKYMDSKLREKAVNWMNEMDDTDLQRYLLQLVQCLKFELHHENALSRFLIRRALRSPFQIGHYLWWHLKSEFDEYVEYHERFGLYMEEYLLFCCSHKHELFVQNAMLKRLEWINKKIVAVPEKKRFDDDIKKFFKQQLRRVNRDLPSSKKGVAFGIPLFPRWKALQIKIDACKYMSSKKVPLWLVFENADPLASDIVVMFKCGDDLRQDMLTLQIIEMMDKFWLHASLDLHLKPYKCLSTGYQAGMLEIVLNSHTVNSISESYGGVFNEKTIDSFIKNYNTSPLFLGKAKELFARSCAGYCIATYVLGISDRHSSNYMVCKNGQFFHIDFGHFLGNWKTKWGIKRERTPLVFTNQMKYAIANETDQLYQQFLTWCSSAYLILRENHRILFVLMRLMVAAGMEELLQIDDILYFQNTLNLKHDTKKASKHISKAIDVALNDWGTKVNNKFHQIRHQNKK